MTPDDLKARTKKFAVDVIRFAKAIPKDHINDVIASQLADSAIHRRTLSSGLPSEVAGRLHQQAEWCSRRSRRVRVVARDFGRGGHLFENADYSAVEGSGRADANPRTVA